MGNPPKETRFRLAAPILVLALALFPSLNDAQTEAGAPPPSNGGIFPLSQVHRGLMATAWTVFTGTKPEPMQVEILGVLRGARGPGHDMILAQLHGAKPEYTGVVAGMSGSPVYVGNKLLGSLSYRIGEFSKDPIAGITPIEQMLEVRDIPVPASRTAPASLAWSPASPQSPASSTDASAALPPPDTATNFQAMETPLIMSGFHPQAIALWKQKMAGTGLDVVMAGGSGSSLPDAATGAGAISPAAWSSIEPGSAVSAQLVRGDLEIAATCTVTYVDPRQLLACGHPILQAGPVSLPMTTTDVVATLASPLNAFKIINTGELIGSFTEDRDSAIRGVFGLRPHMIPVHIELHGGDKSRTLNVEILDLPTLTPQAVLVAMYESLLQSNESTSETSYHVTGSIAVDGYSASPVNVWVSASDMLPAPLLTALQTAQSFARLYSNGARQGALRSVNLRVECIPHRIGVELESARLVSSDIVHPGDTVMLEATLRPWQQPARNVRIPFTVPARLEAGTLRVLVSDAGTLDRTLDQPKPMPRPPGMETALAQARSQHAADRVYVSLLVPETQAGMDGRTLSSLPVSLSNALEPLRSAQDVTLNGESAVVAADAPGGGVVSGFQVLNLRIEPGSGLN